MTNQSMEKFIIAVVVIGVLLVMGIFISSSIQDATRESASSSVSNETLTTVTESGEYLTAYSLNDVVCTTNASGGEIISSGNYTQTNCLIAFKGATTGYNNTDWNVTYTYTYSADTNTSVAAGDLVTALSGGSAWVTILIVVGFATIVLGMLEIEGGYVY